MLMIAIVVAPLDQTSVIADAASIELDYGKKRKKAATGGSGRKFGSCAAARKAGYTNMRRGKAKYSASLNREGDGVACDKAN